VSSLMDGWLLLYNKESNGEHNRQLYLLKSRGMAHSNQVREFLMTGSGLQLRDVYVGREGVLTGSARVAQEAREREQDQLRRREVERRAAEFARRRRQVDAQIQELQEQLSEEQREFERLATESTAHEGRLTDDRATMARSRRTDERAADDGGRSPSYQPRGRDKHKGQLP